MHCYKWGIMEHEGINWGRRAGMVKEGIWREIQNTKEILESHMETNYFRHSLKYVYSYTQKELKSSHIIMGNNIPSRHKRLRIKKKIQCQE